MEDKIDTIKQEKDFFTKARLISDLLKTDEIRLIDLAKRLDVKSSYLCHLLRLNRLSPMIVDGYYSKMITISHLYLISRIKNEKRLNEIYERILTESLTVSQTEEAVREILHQTKTKGNYLSEEEKKEYIDKLKSKLKNLDVKIIQTRIKGKIILEVKGSLESTTATLKKLLAKLMQ